MLAALGENEAVDLLILLVIGVLVAAIVFYALTTFLPGPWPTVAALVVLLVVVLLVVDV